MIMAGESKREGGGGKNNEDAILRDYVQREAFKCIYMRCIPSLS